MSARDPSDPPVGDLPLEAARPPADTAESGASTGFPCAQCGAALTFDPRSGRMACAFCGHTQPVPDTSPWERSAALAEIDYVRALRDEIDAADVEERASTHCNACGAETLFDEAIRATRCPFCASPLVGDPGVRRQFRPKALAPFLIGEKEARDALRKWLGSLWFAPSDLVSLARAGEGFSGVYLPYWTFDADTRSAYRGQRGDAYTDWVWVTVMQNGKAVRKRKAVRKIRWRAASGRVARAFDDVLAPGSRSLPDRLSRKLDGRGWDLSGLQPYKPDFLAGFLSEAYTIDLEEGYVAARAIMDFQIERDVRRDIGGDAQRVQRIDTDVSDVTFKHVLLPVWVAAFRYRDKPFRVLVNGRTGRVVGERPFSWTKIALAVVAALVVAAGLAAMNLR